MVEVAAALCDGGVEIVDRVEMFVGERLVDERPQMFGRLQFGRAGGLIDDCDAVGHGEIFRRVPAGIVDLQNDDAFASGLCLAGEGVEQFGEEGFVEAVREIPHALARGRTHEGRHIKPFVAMMAERDRSFADRRPDAAADRLQTKAMFVARPDFDRFVFMFRGFPGDRFGEFFLNASCSCGVAARGFFGRGA